MDFVRGINAQGKPIAAKCHGILILASAGLLEGRTATAKNYLQREIEKRSGAPPRIRWIDQNVVVDGNFITARTKWALPEFTKALINAPYRVPDMAGPGMA